MAAKTTSAPVWLDHIKIVAAHGPPKASSKAGPSSKLNGTAATRASRPAVPSVRTAKAELRNEPNDDVNTSTTPEALPGAKKIHRQPQAATAALGAALSTKDGAATQPKMAAAKSGAGALTIKAAAAKTKKKPSRHKRLARAFIVADVPMLDSPDWSSDDEVDNPKFNREFRQKHNDQLRKQLKENEAMQRKAGPSDKKATTRAAEPAAEAPMEAAQHAPKSSKDDTAVVSLRDSLTLHRAAGRKAAELVQVTADTVVGMEDAVSRRSSPPPSAQGGPNNARGDATPLDEEVDSSTAASSFYSSGSTHSLPQTSDSFGDEFFFGEYGSVFSDMGASSGSGRQLSVEEGHSPVSVEGASSSSAIGTLQEEPREAQEGEMNTSLHATFAPDTVSPVTQPRITSNHSTPWLPTSCSTRSSSSSPIQAVLADDMLLLPCHGDGVVLWPTSDGTPSAASRQRWPGGVPVLLHADGTITPDRTAADDARSQASVESGVSLAAHSIMAHGRGDPRASSDSAARASKTLSAHRRAAALAEADAHPSTTPPPKTYPTSEAQDNKSVLVMSIGSNEDGEYNLNLGDSESNSLPRRASDLDDFLFIHHAGGRSRVIPLSHDPLQPAVPGEEPTTQSSMPLTRFESTVPTGSYVLPASLGRSRQVSLPGPGASGDAGAEDEVEYWDLLGVSGSTVEGPRSLLARAPSLRRRESLSLLQSTRKNTHYFGSINPSSYHNARLMSTRKAGGSHLGKVNTQQSMVRMYSIFRAGRRTNNTTVAITEPVVGLSAESRPAATGFARRSGQLNGTTAARPSSGDTNGLAYSLLSDSVGTSSGATSRAMDSPKSAQGQRAGHEAPTGPLLASAKGGGGGGGGVAAAAAPAHTGAASAQTNPVRQTHTVTQQQQQRRLSTTGTAASNVDSLQPLMRNAPTFAHTAPANTSQPLSRRASMPVDQGFHNATGTESERRQSVPAARTGDRSMVALMSSLETRTQPKLNLFPDFFDGNEPWGNC